MRNLKYFSGKVNDLKRASSHEQRRGPADPALSSQLLPAGGCFRESGVFCSLKYV